MSSLSVRMQTLLAMMVILAAAVVGNSILANQTAYSALTVHCAFYENSSDATRSDTPLGLTCREAANGATPWEAVERHFGSLGIPWYAWLVFLAAAALSFRVDPNHLGWNVVADVIAIIGGALMILPPLLVGNAIAAAAHL